MSSGSSGAIQPVLPIVEDEPRERQSGIWPTQQIKAAIEIGDIRAAEAVLPEQIQPASLDLRLGGVAYRVPASFLPGRHATVADKLKLFAEEKIDLEQGAVLQTGCVYLVPLMETIRFKKRVSGVANPKSSTGRLDVFARVITDYGMEFDRIPEKYSGPLWLEVAPRSFNVRLRRGSRLTQVRIKSGSPPSSDSFARRLNEECRFIPTDDGPANIKDGAIALSVDLKGDPVTGIVGYRAKRTADHIDLDKINHYDREAFWDCVYRPDRGGIILETDAFHILATKEAVAVPGDVAADMVAYDTQVGEFRVHYAGFFDPGFGYSGNTAVGTPVVLEVRSHEVPFMIDDGQIVGRVLLERLTEPTSTPYGAGIGSSYQGQALTLSKHFKR
ncbi:MAG TPA: 2'-deoxycytidine 5'-triphosphate deaminase [Kiloniellaceae bacterium]|nr:2'-deoxycytidine 5'-triphosphate deaminase [Kiloniellaceae bacterium]